MNDNLEPQSTDQEPDNNPRDDQKRIDSIPLWLQGISENAAASQEPEEGEWQKEQAFVADQETGPTPIDLSDSAPWEKLTGKSETDEADLAPEEEIPLPDWIEEAEETVEVEDEITGVVPLENPEEEIEALEEIDETTEEVLLEQPEEPETAEPIESELSKTIPFEAASTPAHMDQGFEEIQLDEAESEIEDANQDEILPESEEIPEWLREMIAADEKQQAAEESKMASHSDEPTQPVVVSPEQEKQDLAPADEEEQSAEADEVPAEAPQIDKPKRAAFLPNASLSRLTEEPAQEEISSVEEEEPEEQVKDELELHLERDYSAEFDGSGFKPIQFDPPVIEDQPEEDTHIEEVVETEKTEELEEQEIPPQEPVEENTEFVLEDWGTPKPPIELETATPEQPLESFEAPSQPDDSSPEATSDDIPSSLNLARQILEQGEVKEALEIIKPFISQSQYLDEIRDWLLTANGKFEENKSGLWEALGDISSHQGDYPSALNAYAKAIDYLELSRKNEHEIG